MTSDDPDTKTCSNHDGDHRRHLVRRVILLILSLIVVILFIILLIYLILRPTKPRFILQDATVYAFNVTEPTNDLTITIQVTLWSRNPNNRIGVYYEKLDVFATYRNQQITLPTLAPPSYQGHRDITVWSPYLYGVTVPVAPYLTASLVEDQGAGVVLVNVKVDGKVKWKVGNWVSGKYHLWVNCPAYITFGRRSTGFPVLGGPVSGIKYQLATACEVDV